MIEMNVAAGAGATMSDRYDRAEFKHGLRREWAKKGGLGFELPDKKCIIGRNGRKIEIQPVAEMAVTV